jgi:hypothetical protein
LPFFLLISQQAKDSKKWKDETFHPRKVIFDNGILLLLSIIIKFCISLKIVMTLEVPSNHETGVPKNKAPSASEPNKAKISIVAEKLFDVTVILGFITGAAYIVGYAYFYGFLTRLSLRPEYVQVATMEYVWNTLAPLVFVVVLLSPAIVVVLLIPVISKIPAISKILATSKVIKPIAKFFYAGLGNLPLFALSGMYLFAAFNYVSGQDKLYWVLYGAAPLIVALFLTSLKKSLVHGFYSDQMWRAASVAGVAILTLGFAYIYGAYDAYKLIEGSNDRTSSVMLFDKNNCDLLGHETWILVRVDQSNYVVVQKSNPAPEFPLVMMVSKSDVSVAKIQRIN